MYKKLVFIMIPLLFIASFTFGSLTFGATKTLSIGVIGPKGLPHWSPGGMWDGARLARDEINAAGGIHIGSDTYTINLIDEDEHSYPTIDVPKATLAMSNLIASGAKLIIGGFRTEVTAPGLLPVVRSAKVPFFIDGAATASLVNLTTPDQYASDKYIFRGMPTNDTTLLPVICQYLRYYLIPQKLVRIFGQDLDNNASTPNQVRFGVLTEQATWANQIHYVFTSLYALPYLAPGVPNPYYLGPYANLTYQGRIDPYAITDTTPYLDGAKDKNCRLLIIIFSAPIGETLIKQWHDGQYNMLPVGINVMSQSQTRGKTDYYEYEVSEMTMGTATDINPGVTAKWWDSFTGNYTVWPNYIGVGAYNIMYNIKAALESINASDVVAAEDYLDGGSTPSDVLIPYFEKLDKMQLNGKGKYTSGLYGPGSGHDVYCPFVDTNITWPMGYTRPEMVQWINGTKIGLPATFGGYLSVVDPQDQLFSRKTLIPPFMYSLAPWDLNFDGKVNILDISTAASAFGTVPGQNRWNMETDVNTDGKVNILDISNIAGKFGQSAPQWPLP